MRLSAIDWCIVAGVPLLAWVIARFRRQRDSWRGYFLALGQMPTVNVAGTDIGANLTFTAVLLILAEEAYQRGLVVLVIPIFWMIGTFILVGVYGRIRPFVLEGLTLHQTLGRVFESRSIQRWASMWTILSFVGTVGLELYGGVILLRWMGLNSIHAFVGALLLAFVVSAFTVSGGLRGIAIADLLLDASTFIAIGVLVWFVHWSDVSPAALFNTHPPLKADPVFVVAMAVIFVPFQLCTLDTWQRLAAWGGKSQRRPTKWLVSSSVLLCVAFSFPVLCGAIARTAGLASRPGGHIFLEFIKWLHVPPILIGLVAAGLISAILSTADELLNCCSMTLLFDIFDIRRPSDADPSAEPRLVASGKFYTALFSFASCAVVGIALAYGKEISDLAVDFLYAGCIYYSTSRCTLLSRSGTTLRGCEHRINARGFYRRDYSRDRRLDISLSRIS